MTRIAFTLFWCLLAVIFSWLGYELVTKLERDYAVIFFVASIGFLIIGFTHYPREGGE